MKKENTDSPFRLRFDYISFLIFLFIFTIEICIALFVDDKIIRPYGGDFLVVILLYYLLKSFVHTKTIYILGFVLFVAYSIEICQLFDMVSVLGLEDNRLMSTVLGTSFSWGDLVAYTLGVVACWIIEEGLCKLKKISKKKI